MFLEQVMEGYQDQCQIQLREWSQGEFTGK